MEIRSLEEIIIIRNFCVRYQNPNSEVISKTKVILDFYLLAGKRANLEKFTMPKLRGGTDTTG
jgi:hypothetical protein